MEATSRDSRDVHRVLGEKVKLKFTTPQSLHVGCQMVQTGPTIDLSPTYKRKIAPGQTVKIDSSTPRYQFMTMKGIFVVVLALQLTALVAADSHDANSLEHLETKLTRAMDGLNEEANIEIYGDMITLEKVAVQDSFEEPRTNEDPLVSRIEEFLRTRKVQIHLPNDGSSADLFGRALGKKDIGFELKALTKGASEARTKLKKIVLPILLALKLTKIVVLPIVVTLIALVGIKGLGAGLLSLLLSGAVALKALLTPPPPPRVTYGIVKPHDIHHDHWHRSQEEVNQPYRGWAPEYNNDQYPYQEIP